MTDLALWRALKGGDKKALASIYSEHAVALLQYGHKFSRDEQLVEDAIQDLFVELWKNREGLSDTDSIRRYLLVALRRKIYRKLEKSKKLTSEEPEEQLFEAELAIDSAIIDREMARERRLQIEKAMKELSARQKEAIYLKYFQEMDYDAICEIMGISYQSVRNLVHSALKVLKKSLTFWLILVSMLEYLSV